MNSKVLILIIITLCSATALWFIFKFVLPPQKWSAGLVSPVVDKFSESKKTPAPTPKPTPKAFEFNESINLEDELETINPGIKESDFAQLQSVVQDL
jgi:hypothetical protein